LKIREVVHISFTRPPRLIRPAEGLAALAIGLKLLVSAPRNQGPQVTAAGRKGY